MNIKILAASLLLSPQVSSAAILDFDNPSDLGVTLGGSMTWSADGGGHLFNNNYTDDDFIYFSGETFVNSFEMNARHYANSTSSGGSISITASNSLDQVVWSSTVDLSNYNTWDNWLTVTVETAGITQLTFSAPNFSLWPSVDNMVINEPVSQVPVPAAVWLFGSGLIGLVAFAKRRRA